ncbi:MAG: DUF1800 domain-containing protein [Burkholderiales bacterium]|nr:DUF1800 domain-containing protein [Burkholderiales bacterium]
MTWTRNEAAHLLRRAGFGGSLEQVDALVALGSRQRAVDSLLDFDTIADPVWADPNPLALPNVSTDPRAVTETLLFKLFNSRRPLQSKLLWFWHGHFTTGLWLVKPASFALQMERWRTHAAGRFEPFLLAVLEDSAMLQYLDGAVNVATAPNENFARELLEIYTVGSGNFTESTVLQAARALTGWTIGPGDVGVFDPTRHDPGPKTILGQTAAFDGVGLMQLLARDTRTAVRICTRLYQAFVNERVNVWLRDQMVATWTRTGGDLREVLRTMFHSDHFWAAPQFRAIVKTPMDYCFALNQRMGVPFSGFHAREAGWMFERMMQSPFNPPNPQGYVTGVRLLGATACAARSQWAQRVAYSWVPDTTIDAMLAAVPDPATPEQIAAVALARLGAVREGTRSHAAVVAGLGVLPLRGTQRRGALRDALYLCALAPEYQLL